MSWISLQDMLGAILHLSCKEECLGAYNMVAPNYVTNGEFTKVLGKVLKRPTIFSVPVFVMRMIFGEMAEAVLLTGRAVRPKRLIESGYQFLLPEIEGAIRVEAGLGK